MLTKAITIMPPSEKNRTIKKLKGKTKFDLLFKEGEINHEGDLLMRIKKDPSMEPVSYTHLTLPTKA